MNYSHLWKNYLTRLDKALHDAESSVQVDTTWEHIGDQKLRRIIPAITSDVEQFITAQRRTRGFGNLPSISRIISG